MELTKRRGQKDETKTFFTEGNEGNKGGEKDPQIAQIGTDLEFS